MNRLRYLVPAAALLATTMAAPAPAAIIYQQTVASGNGSADVLDDFNDPIVSQTGSLWVTISAGSFSYAEWQINGEQQILWWEDIGEDEPYLNGNEYFYSPWCSVTPGAPNCGTVPLAVNLLGPRLLRIDFTRPVDFNYCIPFQGYGDCAESYWFTGASFYLIAESQVTTTFAIHDTNPVPEPATWAMLVGGFGLVGGALRSRRRRAAVTA